MKKAYLIRYGAFGDQINMSNVIKALDLDGWHISMEYNWKGAQIHAHNPRIRSHHFFEPSKIKSEKERFAWFDRLESIAKNHDLFINFSQSLENSLIAPEESPEYFWPLWMRRQKNTHICYYDQSMKWAGLTAKRYMGWTGEMFFTAEEHEHIKKWLRDRGLENQHVILWALRGTMYQKAVYPMAHELCTQWLDRHPESTIITTGDEFCKKFEWDHPRVIHQSARMPFRQALHLAGYVDMVVTPETGLGIGAGAFGTPKIMLLTAASLKNIVGNDENDYSIQSPAWCSPCTRAIYNTANCPINEKSGMLICVDFDKTVVLKRMEELYANHGLHNLRRRNAPPDQRPVYM